jgi:hypothetical protein
VTSKSTGRRSEGSDEEGDEYGIDDDEQSLSSCSSSSSSSGDDDQAGEDESEAEAEEESDGDRDGDRRATEREKMAHAAANSKKPGVRFSPETPVPFFENKAASSESPEAPPSACVVCPKCTYFNPVESRKCKMCLGSLSSTAGGRKPVATNGRSGSLSSSKKRLALPARRK